MEWLALVLSGLLGGVLVISSLSKFLAAHDFVSSVANYPLMQGSLSGFVAFSVPWVELLLGIALLLGIQLRWAAIGSAAVLLTFTVAMAGAMAQGRRGNCGCGASVFAEEIGWRAIARNLVLMAAATGIAAIGESSLGLGSLEREAFLRHPAAPLFAFFVVAALLITEAAIIRIQSGVIWTDGATESQPEVIPWSSENLSIDAHS